MFIHFLNPKTSGASVFRCGPLSLHPDDSGGNGLAAQLVCHHWFNHPLLLLPRKSGTTLTQWAKFMGPGSIVHYIPVEHAVWILCPQRLCRPSRPFHRNIKHQHQVSEATGEATNLGCAAIGTIKLLRSMPSTTSSEGTETEFDPTKLYI